MIKHILVIARKSMKLTILIATSVFLIICAVALFFKPIYSVTLNGEFVGYSKDKSKLQAKINKYIENGDENNESVAFVQVDNLPEYKMCLLKRNIVTNDDEIFDKIKESGITYYKYYAILEGQEEKTYVADFATAEQIVQQLKEKDSNNIDSISILELYETEMIDFSSSEDAVASLYEEKVVTPEPKKQTKIATTGKVTSVGVSYQKVGLSGVNLIRPISGKLTSRFGAKSSIRSGAHTGLDIAAPKGTPIKAAASGTVTFSGRKGSYGYMTVVSHGNGVETWYAHCSKLYLSAGAKVEQGQTIAEVGSTGNSTGYHLHLEVRINGVAYNPQNYVY